MRLIAAAEGGIEAALVQDENVLSTYAAKLSNTYCGSAGMTLINGGTDDKKCLLTFPSGSDPIKSQAIVDVTEFSTNGVPGQQPNYWFELNPGDVKEVRLSGGTGTVQLCWDNVNTAIYYISYTSSGKTARGGLIAGGFTNTADTSGFTAGGTSSANGYAYCKTVAMVTGGVVGLRIKPLYEPAKIAVFSPTLPLQGYQIISRGELTQEGQAKTTKTITVYRSYSYLPSSFDYAIYSNGAL